MIIITQRQFYKKNPNLLLLAQTLESQETDTVDVKDKDIQHIMEQLSLVFNKNTRYRFLQEQSEDIIKMLSYLPARYCFYILNYIDAHYPGMSWHYIMECERNENLAHEKLISRLQKVSEKNILGAIFSFNIVRLITHLFNDDDSET